MLVVRAPGRVNLIGDHTDAAIIALPYAAPGIETSVIAEDEFLFLCPQDHPLAARDDLAPEQLQDEDVLLLEDGHCLREHALSVCRVTPGRRSAPARHVACS